MKCVSFKLNGQLFGFDIMKVIEVVKEYKIRTIPGVSPIIKGMMNLRGEIITVLDLKKRLNIKENPAPHNDIIIIAQRGERFGLFIDEVMEVVNFNDPDIESENKNIFKIEEDFVLGLSKINDFPIMILSVEKILDF